MFNSLQVLKLFVVQTPKGGLHRMWCVTESSDYFVKSKTIAVTV